MAVVYLVYFIKTFDGVLQAQLNSSGGVTHIMDAHVEKNLAVLKLILQFTLLEQQIVLENFHALNSALKELDVPKLVMGHEAVRSFGLSYVLDSV